METAETLKEKIDLFGFSDEEKSKFQEKFLADCAFFTVDEELDVKNALRIKGNDITRAREGKIAANSVNDINKNYDFVDDAQVTDIYDEDLNHMNSNGVDIYRRVKYFDQYGIPRKNEDGTYKKSIFNEALFREETSEPTATIDSANSVDFESFEPSEPVEVNVPEIEDEDNFEETNDINQNDISDYLESAEKDLNDIESTTTFAQIKSDLERQLAELDALRSQSDVESQDNVFHFNDIEGETYNVGRGRAA